MKPSLQLNVSVDSMILCTVSDVRAETMKVCGTGLSVCDVNNQLDEAAAAAAASTDRAGL